MRQYYEEWQASGLSKSSYCREKGYCQDYFLLLGKEVSVAPLTNKPEKQGLNH